MVDENESPTPAEEETSSAPEPKAKAATSPTPVTEGANPRRRQFRGATLKGVKPGQIMDREDAVRQANVKMQADWSEDSKDLLYEKDAKRLKREAMLASMDEHEGARQKRLSKERAENAEAARLANATDRTAELRVEITGFKHQVKAREAEIRELAPHLRRAERAAA